MKTCIHEDGGGRGGEAPLKFSRLDLKPPPRKIPKDPPWEKLKILENFKNGKKISPKKGENDIVLANFVSGFRNFVKLSVLNSLMGGKKPF